jgi:hypothetical protein
MSSDTVRRRIVLGDVASGFYRRHFEGRPRWTRDLHLLGELIEQFSAAEKQDGMPADRAKAFGRKAQICREEKTAIENARVIESKDDLASLLAELANSQFRLYGIHLAGKSRITRRPALVRRMIQSLRDTRERMLKELSTYRRGAVTRDVKTIESHLPPVENELTMIERTRASLPPGHLVQTLVQELNGMLESPFEPELPKSPAHRLGLLYGRCDEVAELVIQLADAGSDPAIVENFGAALKKIEAHIEQVRESYGFPIGGTW